MSKVTTVVIDKTLRDRFNLPRDGKGVTLKGIRATVIAREFDGDDLGFIIEFAREEGHSVKIQAPKEEGYRSTRPASGGSPARQVAVAHPH